MKKLKYTDIFSKNDSAIFVIEPENDTTIQKMLSDANSKDIESHIALEINDIQTIVEAEGFTSTISSSGRGFNAHKESLASLIKTYRDKRTLKAMLLSFSVHELFSISKIKDETDELNKIFGEDVEIILSILIDNVLASDEIHVNMIIKH